MEHINDFTIHSFRGLRDLKIEKLGQINLLVGNNNSGKTSVLEATSIFCDPFNWRKWLDIGSQREVPSTIRSPIIDRLIWTFPQLVDNNAVVAKSAFIELSASGHIPINTVKASYQKFAEIIIQSLRTNSESGGEEVEVEGIKIQVTTVGSSFDNNQPVQKSDSLTFFESAGYVPHESKQYITILPVQTVNPLSHRTNGLTVRLWSEVVEANLKPETIDLLRFFDPAIEDVDFIAPAENRQLISIKHKKLGRAPLHTFGDGLRRVFTLATTIPRVRGGMLLIDELETAIHTKALEKTFDWLVNACVRNDVQLIATTHSLEALDAVLDASIDERANLVVYRLQQEEHQTTATRFDKEMTRRLREELGMELRY